MTKLFYDHLIMIDDLFDEIHLLEISVDEKQSLKQMIDEMTHHAVLTHVLDILPRTHHEEFLEKFHTSPFDVQLILYLEEKSGKNIHSEILTIGEKLKKEIRSEIKKHKKTKH